MDSLNTSLRVLLPILEELETARSLTVAILLRHGDLAGVLSLSTDPRHYDSAELYFRDCQATNLVRKIKGLVVPGVDRRQSALKKWIDGEHQCYRTNERLSKFIYGSFLDEDLGISCFLQDVRKKISCWIGSKPPDLDTVKGRFGPGATFSDRGRLTTVPDKITSTPTLTDGAKWYLLPYMQTAWFRKKPISRRGLSWVRGNRFMTVPKTALIDRSIAVEPAINVFYQLGLGSSIRRRLSNVTGWSLDCAQEIHRRKALESSRTREFSTLDLSNASDTVSYNLVRLLLPAAWFEELNALRSPSTLVDGKWHVLEKFSSMGNGYTFELETLIFAALISVLLDKVGRSSQLGTDFFVFGDDLIVPDCVSNSVVSMLSYCGFSLNKEKSFSGPVGFRESCGGDFFEGADVRPFYLKDLIYDPWQLVPDINGLRKTLKKLEAFTGRSHLKALDSWMACLPIPVRYCFGPEFLGDVVLHSDESQWRFKWEHGIRYFKGIIRLNQPLGWKYWSPDVVLASALYGVGDGRIGIIPRDSPFSYAVKWVPGS